MYIHVTAVEFKSEVSLTTLDPLSQKRVMLSKFLITLLKKKNNLAPFRCNLANTVIKILSLFEGLMFDNFDNHVHVTLPTCMCCSY